MATNNRNQFIVDRAMEQEKVERQRDSKQKYVWK